MLQLALRNGLAHSLLGHQFDRDRFPCADVLFARAFNVFCQPVMAEVEDAVGEVDDRPPRPVCEPWW